MWKYWPIISIFCIASALAFESRIVGGQEELITVAPYMVSIRYKKQPSLPHEHRCSGTIYSSNIILTTATCVIGLQPHLLQIKAGSSYRTQFDGSLYLVEKYVLHPDFNIWFYDNDLALVKLAFQLGPYPSKKIAAIPLADSLPAAEHLASVAGWGSTNSEANSEFSEHLKMAKVSVVENDKCRQIYGGSRISQAMLCAVADQEDACYGDAGGALVYQEKAVALVSWGRDCANVEYPGVYTNLVLFKSWIESEAGKL
uniref:Peptidase S1 domain-containing protein n=1 Tax=Stomoxys calcitrans TaxID=35570 RepID=A0A1I8PU29_STOCA